MRFSNFALPLVCIAQWSTALPADMPTTALANRASAEVNLYNDLEKRRSIDVWFAKYTNGRVVFRESVSELAEQVATMIKGLSDGDTCAHTVFYIANLAFSYYTTTTGSNCDTTAEKKTIKNAVEKGLSHALDVGAKSALFAFSHGGTWNGHLQMAAADAVLDLATTDGVKQMLDNAKVLANLNKGGLEQSMSVI